VHRCRNCAEMVQRAVCRGDAEVMQIQRWCRGGAEEAGGGGGGSRCTVHRCTVHRCRGQRYDTAMTRGAEVVHSMW